MKIKKNTKIYVKILLVLGLILVGNISFSQVIDTLTERRLIESVSFQISECPDNSFYYSARAEMYLNFGEYDKSLDDLISAIKLDSTVWENYVLKGGVERIQKKHKLSLMSYNRALELNKSEARIYFGRGATYYDMGNYNNAITDYTYAIKNNGNWQGVYYHRGLAYAKLGRCEESLVDFQKAHELDPEYDLYISAIGFAMILNNKIDESFAYLNRAIKLNSKSALNNYYISLYYKAKGDFVKTTSFYNTAKKLGLESQYKL